MIFLRDRQGQQFAVTSNLLKLGRAIDNDIVVADISVSRYHIALQPSQDGAIVFNTGSESGFFINGEWFLDSAMARPGDIVRIGNEEFAIEGQTIAPSDDFAFSTSANSSGSLDVTSRNRKIMRAGLLVAVVVMIGLSLMPSEDQEKNRNPASNEKVTDGLNNESFNDINVTQLGPQELTAVDLYKRGVRELSNNNQIRAIQYLQQSLVEDPTLRPADQMLQDAEKQLKDRVGDLVLNSEKNYKDSRLILSRSQANQALDLMSEQIPGFSFQVQQKQRTLAGQKMPVLSREQIYLDLPCEQTPDDKICSRAVEILKRSRLRLGEENVLK